MSGQADIDAYKHLFQSDNWKKMHILTTEILSIDSRLCYVKIKNEVELMQLKHYNDQKREN